MGALGAPPPPQQKGGGWEKGLQGQKGCFGQSKCRQRTRVIAVPIWMHVCVPMLYTLCFIGSMVPVVCSTSPTPGPERSKHSCQCGYAIVSLSCRIHRANEELTVHKSDWATIHRVKGVCPWSPPSGGPGGKGAPTAPGPTVSIFPVPWVPDSPGLRSMKWAMFCPVS